MDIAALDEVSVVSIEAVVVLFRLSGEITLWLVGCCDFRIDSLMEALTHVGGWTVMVSRICELCCPTNKP